MNKFYSPMLLGCLLALVGCNDPKPPTDVAKDVTSAEIKGQREVARTEQGAEKDLGKAAQKADDRLTTLNNTAAQDGYKVAAAQADSDRQVALAHCEAAGGSAQKMCKDQAEADYKAAKANASATAQSEKQ